LQHVSGKVIHFIFRIAIHIRISYVILRTLFYPINFIYLNDFRKMLKIL
jgi:hypothetical protein